MCSEVLCVDKSFDQPDPGTKQFGVNMEGMLDNYPPVIVALSNGEEASGADEDVLFSRHCETNPSNRFAICCAERVLIKKNVVSFCQWL